MKVSTSTISAADKFQETVTLAVVLCATFPFTSMNFEHVISIKDSKLSPCHEMSSIHDYKKEGKMIKNMQCAMYQKLVSADCFALYSAVNV